MSVETIYSAPVFMAFFTLCAAMPNAKVSWFISMEKSAPQQRSVCFISTSSSPFTLDNHLDFEDSCAYWWWNYYPEIDNKIAFCIGLFSSENIIDSYFESLTNKEYKFENTPLKIFNFYYPKQRFFPNITSNRKELLDFINVSNMILFPSCTN